MITQTGKSVLIELDDAVRDEMAAAMADGLDAIQNGGLVSNGWTTYCIAGCRVRWEDESERFDHEADCPLVLALAVNRLCPEVLKNVRLIDECLDMTRRSAETLPPSAETLSVEEKTMSEEPTIHESNTLHQFKSVPPLCPHCEEAGKRTALTPKGRKLECLACGNVFWAKDPTGAKSRNEVPQ